MKPQIKTTALLVVLAVLMCACGSIRKITNKEKSETKNKETTTFIEYFNRDSTQFIFTRDTGKATTVSAWQRETTTQETLDTTGRVVARTTTTREAGKEHQETRNDKTTTEQTEVHQAGKKAGTTTRATTQETVAVKNETTKKGLPSWFWYVVFSLAIVVFVHLAARKWLNFKTII